MNVEGNTEKKDYLLPVLFSIAVGLVFVFLIISIAANQAPSIKNGATVKEIESYAYKLLSKDNGTNAISYNEAIAYYVSQIEAASDKEQKFNLQLDFAVFYGKTGDPSAGIHVLNDIDAYAIPLDARYYLYATYIYLYESLGDETLAKEYYQRIETEGIDEYFAGIDDGSITPSSKNEGNDCTEDCDAEDTGDDSGTENTSEEIFNEEAL